MDSTANFYSRPSYESVGAGFPVFSGSRRQRGGSILGSIKSFLLPTLKNVGKRVLKTALREGVGFAKDVAGDVLEGRNIKDSLKQRGISRARRVGRRTVKKGMTMASNYLKKTRGSGRIRKRRRRTNVRRRTKTLKRKTLRKGKRRAKSTRAPAAKRRRKANF